MTGAIAWAKWRTRKEIGGILIMLECLSMVSFDNIVLPIHSFLLIFWRDNHQTLMDHILWRVNSNDCPNQVLCGGGVRFFWQWNQFPLLNIFCMRCCAKKSNYVKRVEGGGVRTIYDPTFDWRNKKRKFKKTNWRRYIISPPPHLCCFIVCSTYGG